MNRSHALCMACGWLHGQRMRKIWWKSHCICMTSRTYPASDCSVSQIVDNVYGFSQFTDKDYNVQFIKDNGMYWVNVSWKTPTGTLCWNNMCRNRTRAIAIYIDWCRSTGGWYLPCSVIISLEKSHKTDVCLFSNSFLDTPSPFCSTWPAHFSNVYHTCNQMIITRKYMHAETLALQTKGITMDDLRFRLNFNLSKNNEIYHHS